MGKKAFKTWKNRIVGSGEMPAAQFLANPSNARVHPKAQQEALKGALNELGWIQNVIINKATGHVIDGHARIAEALKRGDETPVPYVEVELTDDEEKLALATLDPISAMAAYDKTALDALLQEVNTGEAALQTMLSELASDNGLNYGADGNGAIEDVEPQIDKAAELQEKWQVKRGDVWQLGNHRLMCGDSTSAEDVSRLMGGEKAELLFTSPPYADMREYKGGDLSVENLAQFVAAFRPFSAYQAVNLGIKRDKGAIVQYWDTYIKAAQDCGYKLLSWNVWDQGQNGAVGKLTAMFPIEHEWIFVFGEKPKDLIPTVPNKDAGNVDTHVYDRDASGATKKKGAIKIRPMREMGTVSRVPPQLARNIDTSHPAMFPVKLVEDYLRAMTSESDSVCEPFSGSGTTLIACEQLNRKCRAMEISPEYVSVALERWATATGKTPERMS